MNYILAQEPLPEEPLPEEPLPEEPLPEQLLAQNPNELNCEFSKPFYWDNTNNVFRPLEGNPIHYIQGQNWAYSGITCSSTKELIQNPDTGAEFYIDKTITYGDALLFWFLTIFSVALIASIIFKFFWRKW
jgi:hypothetical protein